MTEPLLGGMTPDMATYAKELRQHGIVAELDESILQVEVDDVAFAITETTDDGVIVFIAPLASDWPLIERIDLRVLLSEGGDADGDFDYLTVIADDDGSEVLYAVALQGRTAVRDLGRICREFAASVVSLQRRAGLTEGEVEDWFLERRFSFLVALGNLFIARRIAEHEAPKLRARMDRAIREKERLVYDTFRQYLDGKVLVAIEPDTLTFLDEETTQQKLVALRRPTQMKDKEPLAASSEVLGFLFAHVEGGMAERVVLEHVFTEPYAPYDIDVSGGVHEEAVAELAEAMGAPGDLAQMLFRVAKLEAAKHNEVRDLNAPRATALAATGVALIAAAHVAPHMVAAHAGLTGAAAQAHGMAAMGIGHGMAGGQMVLHNASKAGYAALGIGVGGAFQLGGKRLVVSELTKLQTRAVALMDDDERRDVTADLERSLDEMRDEVAVEQEISDSGSPRIKDREATIKAVKRAIQSIKETEYGGADEALEALEGAKQTVRRGIRDLKRWWEED